MDIGGTLRAIWKGAWFSGVVAGCALDFAWSRITRGRSLDRSERARWLSRWAKRALPCFSITVQKSGSFPAGGLLVSNHLSYTDILVYSSLGECSFVAKDELRSWPIFGFLSKLAGTLFIDRTRRSDTARLNDQLADVLREGHVAVVFPEGTSSDGSQVLHFHSSLFEPAIEAGVPITAAHIRYELPNGGEPGNEVAYWGEMTLLPHLLHLLSVPAIVAHVGFAERGRMHPDRKTAAAATREEIIALGTAQPANLPVVRFKPSEAST